MNNIKMFDPFLAKPNVYFTAYWLIVKGFKIDPSYVAALPVEVSIIYETYHIGENK